jgi:hypothetical protein
VQRVVEGFVIVFCLVTAATVWITAAVSATKFSDSSYRAAGRSRGSTIALILSTGVLGGLYYWLAIRTQVAACVDPSRDVAERERVHEGWL